MNDYTNSDLIFLRGLHLMQDLNRKHCKREDRNSVKAMQKIVALQRAALHI